MRIEVRLYATLRRYVPSAVEGIIAVDVPEGSTAGDVIAKVNIDAEEVRILMINGRSSPLDKTLAEGDRMGLFPAVGGG
jgi:molybdopterin synthase sulfur carrier subunit